jgi:hypothetical protein
MMIMHKMKTLLTAVFVLPILSLTFTPVIALAANPPTPVDELRCGTNAGATGDCHKKPDSPSLNEIIAKIINVISSLVAAVAVIMIIVGGFRYVVSAGDSNKVGAAKSTITNAIIGLVIAVFAQVIVRYVLHQVQ